MLAEREAEFFRSLRPGELRDLPDGWYEAVARQARRIAAADWRLRRVRRDIDEAREMIAADTFPRRWIDFGRLGKPERCLYFDDTSAVLVCWLVDVASVNGAADLSAIYRVAQDYRTDDRPWHRICAYSIVGSLRTWSAGFLVERVAPRTWALTEQGQALMTLVFGDDG